MKSTLSVAAALLTGNVLAVAAGNTPVTLLPDNPQIKYSWNGTAVPVIQVGHVNGNCGTPNSQLFDTGAAASMSFTGTEVNVTYYLDTMGADFVIFIDDVAHKVNNRGDEAVGPNSCSSTTDFLSGPLVPGEHTVTVINTSGAHIYLKGFNYTLSDSTSCTSEVCPAASKTPIIIGVVIGIVCLLIALAMAAWTWHSLKKHKANSDKPWLDGDDNPAGPLYRDMHHEGMNPVDFQAVPWTTGVQQPITSQEVYKGHGAPVQSTPSGPQSHGPAMAFIPSQSTFTGPEASLGPGASADIRLEVSPTPPRYDFKNNNA